jgi:hypothetical protein
MAALLLVVAPTPMSRAGPGREGVLGLAEWRFELGRMSVQQSGQKDAHLLFIFIFRFIFRERPCVIFQFIASRRRNAA